jgi:hypothetical protein
VCGARRAARSGAALWSKSPAPPRARAKILSPAVAGVKISCINMTLSTPERLGRRLHDPVKEEQEMHDIMATKPDTPQMQADLASMKIKWDDSNMKSSYANVCNVTSTREEVVMLFGMNQAWNRGQKEVTIQLTDRIVISPFAAKRLSLLLGNVVTEYEKRFGVLNIEAGAAGGATK